MRCAWCRRDLEPGKATYVPAAVKVPAAVALAFGHGGMWVFRELSHPFCAPCRRFLVPFVLAATLVVLGLAAGAVALWLSRPV